MATSLENCIVDNRGGAHRGRCSDRVFRLGNTTATLMRTVMIAMLLITAAVTASAQTTRIYGTIYMPDGVTPRFDARVSLLASYSSTHLISTLPVHVRTDSNGYFWFTVPRSSNTVFTVQAPIRGFERIGGVTRSVGDVDSAELRSLLVDTPPTALGVVLADVDTVKRWVRSYAADSTRQRYSGNCSMEMWPGDTLSKLWAALPRSPGFDENNCTLTGFTVNYHGGVIDSISSAYNYLPNIAVVLFAPLEAEPVNSYASVMYFLEAGAVTAWRPTGLREQKYVGILDSWNADQDSLIAFTTVEPGAINSRGMELSDVVIKDSHGSIEKLTAGYTHSRIFGDTLLTSLHGNAWDGAVFMSSELRAVHCENSYFNNTRLVDTRITNSHFDNTKWIGTRWVGVMLENVELSGVAGSGQPYPGITIFDSTTTTKVIATGCTFYGTSWVAATRSLTGAALGWWTSIGCDYQLNNFTNANLTLNVFLSCRMTGITWTGAICTNANFTGCQGMPDKTTFKAAVADWTGVIWIDGLPI